MEWDNEPGKTNIHIYVDIEEHPWMSIAKREDNLESETHYIDATAVVSVADIRAPCHAPIYSTCHISLKDSDAVFRLPGVRASDIFPIITYIRNRGLKKPELPFETHFSFKKPESDQSEYFERTYYGVKGEA